MKKKYVISLMITIILFIFSFIIALMVGRYTISPQGFFNAIFTSDTKYNMDRSIIVNLRLSRTLMACLSGIGLSISGLLYQELFQNKLVSPDLLGVANGSGVGAAFAILLGLSSYMTSSLAFIVGISTVGMTIIISKIFRNKSSSTLLLSGVIVSGLMSSILSMIKYFANPETQLSDITFWLMGSFQDSKMIEVYILGVVVLISIIILILISFRINIIGLGRYEAEAKGLNYTAYRLFIIIIATLLTATSVAFSGTISWIGLVIPHIVRLIVGKNTTRSIPLTITFGATFMVIVDILSRTFTTNEIPLSAVTGLFGTIIFVIILFTQRRRNHDA